MSRGGAEAGGGVDWSCGAMARALHARRLQGSRESESESAKSASKSAKGRERRERESARESDRARDRESETVTDSASEERETERARQGQIARKAIDSSGARTHTHPQPGAKKIWMIRGSLRPGGGGGVGLRQASGSETVQEWAKHFHSFKSFPERSVAVTEHLQENKRQSLRGERGGGEVAGDGSLRR